MRGFFKQEPTEQYFIPERIEREKRPKSSSGGKKASTVRTLDCEGCGLYKEVHSPKMPPTGQGVARALIIGEAPGETEDLQGTQLVGGAGYILRRKLQQHGFDLDYHFWKTNTVQCRPTKISDKGNVINRIPTDRELSCCHSRLMGTIRELNPTYIFLMGERALDAFYLNRDIEKDWISVSSWRGLCIPDKATGAWVLPLFSPSFVQQNKDANLEAIYDKDLRFALSCLNRPRPTFQDFESRVQVLLDFKEVCSCLENVIKLKQGLIVFDYETTSIKPYFPGHKIHTVAFCCGQDAYAFPLQYPGAWNDSELSIVTDLWKKILIDKTIKKAAHNAKFESKWSSQIINCDIQNWEACTMINQHILRACSGGRGTGLKLQAFLRWGVEPYDRDVEQYMKAPTVNDFNRLHECPLDKLLLYNGMDAVLEYELFKEQEKEFRKISNRSLLQAKDLFHEGWQVFVEMENEGIPTDLDYYIEQRKYLTKTINDLYEKLEHSKEAKAFKDFTGKEMDWGSNKDLGVLFYDILQIPVAKRTAKEKPSVDKSVVNDIDSPIAKILVDLRKYLKIRDTYLGQFEREIYNNVMHPDFTLHIAETGRSSSSNPNFQNIPARDIEARTICRSGIVPGGDEWILAEADYSAIEVRGNAIYSQDPVLCEYCSDHTKDMHRDVAMDEFFMTKEQIKEYKDKYDYGLRHIGKNMFVFPEFYGDWYKACAQSSWKAIQPMPEVLVHLKKHGIHDYQQFENHMKKVEDYFWDRFRVTKNWRENVIQQQYQQDGYTDSFFGFRRDGYMRRNQVANAPVQGTAFHMLLWSLIELNKIRKAEQWKSKIIGQIHDAGVFRIHKTEKDHVMKTIRYVMCEKILEGRPWIIVPLEIEFKIYYNSFAKGVEE